MAAIGVTSPARVGVIKVRASSVQGAEPVQRVTSKVLAAGCCVNHGQRRGEAWALWLCCQVGWTRSCTVEILVVYTIRALINGYHITMDLSKNLHPQRYFIFIYNSNFLCGHEVFQSYLTF